MGDLSQVYDALRQADAAGNTADAQRLADYIRSAQQAPTAAVAKSAQPAPGFADLMAQESQGDQEQVDPDLPGWGRALGLTGRNIIEGATFLPVMAGDAIARTTNALGGNMALPSQTLSGDLDALGFPRPQTALEKGGGIIEQGLVGGGVQKPLDQAVASIVSRGAPAGFVPPAVAKAQANSALLRRAQQEDYVMAPATTNPTFVNRTLESIAGKQNMQLASRAANDQARTDAASRAMGLNPDAPLTKDATQAVIKEAGQDYAAARKIPEFPTDQQYLDELTDVTKEHAGANASFPGAARPDIEDTVSTYLQPKMTGDAAVSAINLLRDKASAAFTAGDKEAGRAYRAISAAIQGQLERAPNAPAGLVQRLVAARRRMGIASDVLDSQDPNGTPLGPKLAAASPPPGSPLKTSADFAEQYPLLNKGAQESGSRAHALGVWGSVIAGLEAARAAAEHGYSGTALGVGAAASLPLIREAAQRFLLSRLGQKLAIPAAASAATTAAPGAVSGIGASGAAAAAFLNQLDQVEQARQQSQRGAGAIPRPNVTGNSTL